MSKLSESKIQFKVFVVNESCHKLELNRFLNREDIEVIDIEHDSKSVETWFFAGVSHSYIVRYREILDK